MDRQSVQRYCMKENKTEGRPCRRYMLCLAGSINLRRVHVAERRLRSCCSKRENTGNRTFVLAYKAQKNGGPKRINFFSAIPANQPAKSILMAPREMTNACPIIPNDRGALIHNNSNLLCSLHPQRRFRLDRNVDLKRTS